VIDEPGQQWIDFGDERTNKMIRMTELIIYTALTPDEIERLKSAGPGESVLIHNSDDYLLNLLITTIPYGPRDPNAPLR